MRAEVQPISLPTFVSQEQLRNSAAFSLDQTFNFYKERGIDVRLIGSVGRNVSLFKDLPEMQKVNIPKKTLRDFDLLVIGSRKERQTSLKLLREAEKISYPFPLDISMFVDSNEKGFFIKYRDLSYRVSPEVFRREVVNVRGVNIPTLNPNTLFHLTALYVSLRPKDFKNLLTYARNLKTKNDILPEGLFEPFHELIKAKKDKYIMDTCVRKLQAYYETSYPLSLKKIFNPLLKPLKANYQNNINL